MQRLLSPSGGAREGGLTASQHAEIADCCSSLFSICEGRWEDGAAPDPRLATSLLVLACELLTVEVLHGTCDDSLKQEWEYQTLWLTRSAFLLFAVAAMACPADTSTHSAEEDDETMLQWRDGTFANDMQTETKPRLVVAAANRQIARLFLRAVPGDGECVTVTPAELLELLPATAYAALLSAMAAMAAQEASRVAGPPVGLSVDSELLAAEQVAVRDMLEAASGDAGYAALRDLVLSFRSQRKLIGMRRTLLLTRTQCESLRERTPEVLRQTHATVSGGPAHLFATSTDELDRCCCLLAGIAMQKQSSVDGRPFDGHVGLPFIAGWASCAVRLVDGGWVTDSGCFGHGIAGLLAASAHSALFAECS